MNGQATNVRLQLLYFDGCPSYRRAWNDIVAVASEEHLDVNVQLTNVDSLERADALQFAGSPSIKVNGEDLEGYDGPGVMACRVYRENNNQGWPSRELLARRLREATAEVRADEVDQGAISTGRQ